MRCFRLAAHELDGVAMHGKYRLLRRGELNSVAEGVPDPDSSEYGERGARFAPCLGAV